MRASECACMRACAPTHVHMRMQSLSQEQMYLYDYIILTLRHQATGRLSTTVSSF